MNHEPNIGDGLPCVKYIITEEIAASRRVKRLGVGLCAVNVQPEVE